MVNSCVLIGRLATDPELKYTQGGVALTQFVLAVKRNHSAENGEQDTDFIPITAWRQPAEFAAEYLGKGRLVSVEGSIRVNKWKDDGGENRTSTEVVVERLHALDKPKTAQEEQPSSETQAARSSGAGSANGGSAGSGSAGSGHPGNGHAGRREYARR